MQRTPVGRVLVVDDAESIRRLLVDFFTSRGYEVTAAETGEEGIAKLQRDPEIEVVFLDYQLPDTDGIEVLRRIKPSHSAEVILLTGMLTDELARQAARLGASACFAKPPDLSLLEQELIAGVRRVRQKRDTAARRAG